MPARRHPWLPLIAGAAVLAISAGCYLGYAMTHPLPFWLDPVDLGVYRSGGLIAAHVPPWYDPHRASPLYDWPGHPGLRFTYTPFAALLFTMLTVAPLPVLARLSVAVNVLALAGSVWWTLAALDREPGARPGQPDSRPGQTDSRPGQTDSRVRTRAGAALALTAVLAWTEPVQRTLYLGQIELVLLALIVWDAGQPDRRWWKGAGIGVAAGVKLVPLIFIPYLLLTGRRRAAAVATAVFAGTAALGFAVLPADSARWWFGGVFARGGRAGFTAWAGNQSLSALITRLAGSVTAGHGLWLAAAAVTVAAGLAAAALTDLAGYPVAGFLTCGLTGVLVSPISWDHHWVWVVPGVTALLGYAVRLRWRANLAREAAPAAPTLPGRMLVTTLPAGTLAGAAAAITGLFAAWPAGLFGRPADPSGFSLGLIWLPPNTNPATFDRLGDRPWYPEYHWHGTGLVTGNLYILIGLTAFAGLIVLAAGLTRGIRRGLARCRTRRQAHSTASPAAVASSTAGTAAS